MARPVTYDDALRNRLLDVTAEMVDRLGSERLSLRDIARKAGTSTSAVYSLFGNKAQLLAAVIEHGFASFARAQQEVEKDGLRALGHAYRDWAKANPALYRLMFGGAITTAADYSLATAATSPALEPLLRALTPRAPENPVWAAVIVWAQVHGAVSLELTRVAPPEVGDWDSLFEAGIDAVERAFPDRSRPS